ncbi:MAG: phage holin [Lachnospiraceae bacterium]|nr:phage holin [Lachnospiraceae bacterium]
MNDILFEVLKAVVVLVIALVARYAVPWIRLQVENTKYAWVIQCAELAVRSAEQTILGNKTGPEKKAIVTKFLKEQLSQKNISISDEQLNTLIEAAVYTLKQEQSR